LEAYQSLQVKNTTSNMLSETTAAASRASMETSTRGERLLNSFCAARRIIYIPPGYIL
jgi:hypothetical protein